MPRQLERGAFIAAVTILGGIVLWKGIPLNFAGLDVNRPRNDTVIVSGSDSAQLVKQDASQRSILLVPRSEQGKSRFSACSEPPPDVAQNIIQSVNTSLDAIAKRGSNLDATIAAKMTGDLKSTAEQVFQRSQGIQLLRDTMFRLCEALQNGVIEKDDYRTLIQSLITTANFIIPFEQCTGMARGNLGSLPSETLDKLLNSCLQSAGNFSAMVIEFSLRAKMSGEPLQVPAPVVNAPLPAPASPPVDASSSNARLPGTGPSPLNSKY